MGFFDFVIGTGIVWILTALVVNPLAMALTRSRNRTPQLADGVPGPESAQVTPEPDTGSYILVDVLVMAFAGFLIGIALGWFFIGIAWRAKAWPGLITFVVASLIGSAMHG